MVVDRNDQWDMKCLHATMRCVTVTTDPSFPDPVLCMSEQAITTGLHGALFVGMGIIVPWFWTQIRFNGKVRAPYRCHGCHPPAR
jgi:hypothetical protein